MEMLVKEKGKNRNALGGQRLIQGERERRGKEQESSRTKGEGKKKKHSW